MRALLISPDSQTIEEIDIVNYQDIVTLIGTDTIESDEVNDQGDRLYFDEECFLRGTSGRFQLDRLIPVAGKGIIAGSAKDGTQLQDVSVDINELTQRIKYL